MNYPNSLEDELRESGGCLGLLLVPDPSPPLEDFTRSMQGTPASHPTTASLQATGRIPSSSAIYGHMTTLWSTFAYDGKWLLFSIDEKK